jgi:hypothetical protein
LVKSVSFLSRVNHAAAVLVLRLAAHVIPAAANIMHVVTVDDSGAAADS